MAELTETEIKMVQRQGKAVAARYEQDPDDVTQEIWVWWFGEGANYVAKCRQSDERTKLYKAAYNAAIRYCEKERKATLGYDWRDDYRYTRPEVQRILPLALDPEYIPNLAGGGLNDEPASPKDPACGGSLLASIVDVRNAFVQLSDSDAAYLITAVVKHDHDWAAVSAETGLKESSAYAKYMTILDRMVTRHLGRNNEEG